MKKLLNTFCIILCLGLSVSCSNNETIFTEDLSIDIKTNGLLELSKSGFVEVAMTGPSTIEGFTRGRYFYSDDLLQSYSIIGGGIGFSEIVFRDNDFVTLFDYDRNNFDLNIIDKSISNSSHYKVRFTLKAWETVKINPYYYSGFIDYKSADFISKTQGWIAADYERGSNGPHQDQFPHGIRIYEVIGDTCVHISTIKGFGLQTKDVIFENEKIGYVLAYKDEMGYIFKTTDGGNSWAELWSFENEPKKLLILNGSHLLIECVNDYIQSSDDGESWVNVGLDKEIIYTTFDGSGLLYSLCQLTADRFATIGYLLISEDNGLTWKRITEIGNFFYGDKISFFDRYNGIAYSSRILQITSDGGQTWELLAFPVEMENN